MTDSMVTSRVLFSSCRHYSFLLLKSVEVWGSWWQNSLWSKNPDNYFFFWYISVLGSFFISLVTCVTLTRLTLSLCADLVHVQAEGLFPHCQSSAVPMQLISSAILGFFFILKLWDSQPQSWTLWLRQAKCQTHSVSFGLAQRKSCCPPLLDWILSWN